MPHATPDRVPPPGRAVVRAGSRRRRRGCRMHGWYVRGVSNDWDFDENVRDMRMVGNERWGMDV